MRRRLPALDVMDHRAPHQGGARGQGRDRWDMIGYRDRALVNQIVQRLKERDLHMRLMHVCGTHQDTLVRYGLDRLLGGVGVDIRQGPGCPVCVTTPHEIEEAITLARKGVVVATFGDMFRVPGVTGSLSDMRAEGSDVKIVYGIEDALSIARRRSEEEVVWMAIGFETTAPSTAYVLANEPPPNFSVLCCHRLIPPAMEAILKGGEIRLDGFIDPGHVSVIIGCRPYESLSKRYGIPQVIAGFEPLDVMMAVYMIASQIERGEGIVENEYTRTVTYEGNKKALSLMREVFEPQDVRWRGFPSIPASGLGIRSRYGVWDARKRWEDDLADVEEGEEPPGCRCGDVLRGLVEPEDCGLFGTRCTPLNPVGPCMVSGEGSCNILYRYGRSLRGETARSREDISLS